MTSTTDIFTSIARIRNTVIRHPQFDLAYNALVESYEMNRKVGISQHYLFVGESGTGKSTIKNLLSREFPPRQELDHAVVPILIINTPSLPTVKNLAEELLMRLGDPLFSRGSAIDKTSRILRYLKSCEVKLMIIDELQHFIDQGKRKAPREVSDWLKSLIEQANVATVLMGLERSEKILEVNEQLRRRFSRRIELRPFRIDNVDDQRIFIGVFKRLEEALGVSERMDFQSSHLVAALHYATNGIIDYMVKLLIGAYEIAQRLQYSSIKIDCLEQAFKEYIWVHGVAELNPFNRKFTPQRLDKKGMPFSKQIFMDND